MPFLRFESTNADRVISAASCAAATLFYWLFFGDLLFRHLVALKDAFLASYMALFTLCGFFVGRARWMPRVVLVLAASYPCSVLSYLVATTLLAKPNQLSFDLVYVALLAPFLVVKAWVPGVIGGVIIATIALGRRMWTGLRLS